MIGFYVCADKQKAALGFLVYILFEQWHMTNFAPMHHMPATPHVFSIYLAFGAVRRVRSLTILTFAHKAFIKTCFLIRKISYTFECYAWLSVCVCGVVWREKLNYKRSHCMAATRKPISLISFAYFWFGYLVHYGNYATKICWNIHFHDEMLFCIRLFQRTWGCMMPDFGYFSPKQSS